MTRNELSAAETALLRGLEEDLLKPEIRRSAERVAHLLTDDFIEFGSSGLVFDKRQVIESLQQEPDTAHAISVVDFAVRRLAPNVMLVTYRAASSDKPGSRLRSSIWKLIEGRWQMVFHQGTPSRN